MVGDERSTGLMGEGFLCWSGMSCAEPDVLFVAPG